MKKEILNKAKELVEMLIEEEKKQSVQLSEIPAGGKFDTGIGRFIVLEQKEDSTVVITEDLYRKNVKYDDSSNKYRDSELAKLLENDVYPEFLKEFGAKNLLCIPASLTTVDMQNKEEEICAKVRPLTFEEARKYNELLVNKDLDDWYWTCTAWSTEERGWKYSVAVVSPSGDFLNYYYINSYGVRPVCIFSSSIFESCKGDDE